MFQIATSLDLNIDLFFVEISCEGDAATCCKDDENFYDIQRWVGGIDDGYVTCANMQYLIDDSPDMRAVCVHRKFSKRNEHQHLQTQINGKRHAPPDVLCSVASVIFVF